MAKCNSVTERRTREYGLHLMWKILEPVGDQKESMSFNISQGELGSEMLYGRPAAFGKCTERVFCGLG